MSRGGGIPKTATSRPLAMTTPKRRRARTSLSRASNTVIGRFDPAPGKAWSDAKPDFPQCRIGVIGTKKNEKPGVKRLTSRIYNPIL